MHFLGGASEAGRDGAGDAWFCCFFFGIVLDLSGFKFILTGFMFGLIGFACLERCALVV